MNNVTNALFNCGIEITIIAGIEKDKIFEGEQLNNSTPFTVHHIPYWTPKKRKTLLSRIYNKLCIELINIFNDSGFVKKAYNYSKYLINNDKPDILLSVSSPFESHLVGYLLKRKCNIPWITFFSDPWPLEICPMPYQRTSIWGFYKNILQNVFLLIVIK